MMQFSRYKIKYPLRSFFLKLILFFAIVFVLDHSIGYILRYFYFKQTSGLEYRTTYSIETTKADILIFGSSRANHHYQPDIFEKSLNLSCYNAGQEGNFIFYDYGILKSVLKRYTPKIVILDFRNGELAKNQDSYDRISFLLPYYKTHPEMRSIIELKSPYEKLKLLSSIYPYNSSLFTIAAGNSKYNTKARVDIKGYVPLMEIWNGSILNDTSTINYEIDSMKLKVYESFIHECINASVKLYIVCGPYFSKSNYTNYSITLGHEIAKRYNLNFFDYSKDPIFTSNSRLFADINHLNNEGAKVFSGKVIDDIRKTRDTNITLFDTLHK